MNFEHTKEVLIVKYGEIALRGRNRHIYEGMLLDAIRKNLNNADAGEFYLRKEQGRFVVEWDTPVELSRMIPHISCIFGITSVCIVMRLAEQTIESIQSAALTYVQEHCQTPATFKVTTKRANKQFPMQSDQISAHIGGFLLDNIEGLKVNLSAPDFTLKIEIRQRF